MFYSWSGSREAGTAKSVAYEKRYEEKQLALRSISRVAWKPSAGDTS